MTKDVKNLSEIIKDAAVPLEYKKKEMAKASELEEKLRVKHSNTENQARELERELLRAQEQLAKLKEDESTPSDSIVKEWIKYEEYFISETMDTLIEKFIELKEEYEKTGEELVLNYRKIEEERRQIVSFMRSEGIDGGQSLDNKYKFDKKRMKKGFIDTQGNQNFNDLMFFCGI